MLISELGFYLNGELYPNNSIVNIADIGVGPNALHCITDREQCCSSVDGGASGEWYLPREPVPVVGNEDSDFSQTRVSSAVLLNRRNNDTSPAGLYHCDILDSSGVLQSLFIALYNATAGEILDEACPE